MIIRLSQGNASVQWNDHGDPLEIYAGGLTYAIREEQELRDLHECLDFLFGRKS